MRPSLPGPTAGVCNDRISPGQSSANHPELIEREPEVVAAHLSTEAVKQKLLRSTVLRGV